MRDIHHMVVQIYQNKCFPSPLHMERIILPQNNIPIINELYPYGYAVAMSGMEIVVIIGNKARGILPIVLRMGKALYESSVSLVNKVEA